MGGGQGGRETRREGRRETGRETRREGRRESGKETRRERRRESRERRVGEKEGVGDVVHQSGPVACDGSQGVQVTLLLRRERGCSLMEQDGAPQVESSGPMLSLLLSLR